MPYAIIDSWAGAPVFEWTDAGPETLIFTDRIDAIAHMANNDLSDSMPDGSPRFTVIRSEWSTSQHALSSLGA